MRRPEDDVNADILRRHGPTVWRTIVRILGNDGHDAADCYQQAFVELVSRHNRVRDVRNAGALLKRIAAARAIDVIRRRVVERRRQQTAIVTLVAGNRTTGPDAQAEAAELLDDLRLALAEIPDAQATAFVLLEVEGLSREEAGQVMGVTVGHLGVLLHRARAALRSHLKSHEPRGGHGRE